MKNTIFFMILAILLFPLQELYSQNCSHGATTSVKGNKLYLYFPTSDDATFQSPISGETTAPLPAFDVADLDSGIGTTTQLRDRIFEIVTEDYCEFNVEVIQTTTAPSTTGVARWNIVGMSTDRNGTLYGIAQNVDIGDSNAQDYARVWAGSFDNAYGPTGTVVSDVLGGANSTLERWAAAIGSTTSHEAGHNYGLGHNDSASRTGEDAQKNHILATGSTVRGEPRTQRRHFSDNSYEILAHNVGLNIMTVYNWDFINPNAETAHSLEITLLSNASSLNLSTWWNGSRSPWRDPTITATGGTQSFQGTNYNEFTLTFSTDKSWSNGPAGEVPGGVEFHIGAGFSESDLVIVYDTKLKDSGGSDLALHPRMADFDRGATDMESGDFDMVMYNTNLDAGNLIIQDLSIQYLPRLVDIDAMLDGEPLRDHRGFPIVAHGSCNPRANFELKDNKIFHLSKLTDERYVDIIYDSKNCKPGLIINSPQDMDNGEVKYCPDGNALSLFPATSVYVTATVIDPNARYFDRETGNYVNGPLKSKVFYQFGGIVPDFNENGIDDLIDIREGTSVDENNNGIPDEVDTGEPQPDPDAEKSDKLPWWIYLILVILILIIIYLYFKRRKLD